MPKFRVEALERFLVWTVYRDVEASDAASAEQRCKAGEVPYDKFSNEEGDDQWVQTLEVKEQD